MATSAPSLSKVLSETRQIIKAQRRNFYALGFLFLFPLYITTLLYLTLQSLFNNTEFLFLALALYVPNLVLSLCAVGSITYTALHGLSGEAIKLKSAIKSISSSFFPLLGTTLLVQIITFLIAFIFSALAFFGTLSLSGFQNIDQLFSSPNYFVGPIFTVLVVVLELLVVICLQMNWSLASVVVVAESAWGFAALKRSKILIKGNRGIALSLYLIFGFVSAVFVWINSYTSAGAYEWKCLWLILALQVFITSGFLTLIQLHFMTAATVLYAYCKAIHDQSEFSGEYVRLLLDDDQKFAVV